MRRLRSARISVNLGTLLARVLVACLGFVLAMPAPSSAQAPAPKPPTISQISPQSGTTAGGTSVTITGTDLLGATAVSIGGVAATGVAVVNDTTILATTGAHPPSSAQSVQVTTPGGTNSANQLFTYLAPPKPPMVTQVTPSSGTTAGGTSITITGAELTGTAAVTIGGVPASFTVVNATTITATTGPHAAGAMNVQIISPGGITAPNTLYTYVALTPTISGITPSTGTTQGGTAIIITGTDFTGATSITIGGTAVASFTVVNATTITATTAARSAGVAAVLVTTPVGAANSPSLYYTYVTPPTLTLVVQSSYAAGEFTFTGNNGWKSQTIKTVTADSPVAGASQMLTAARSETTIYQTLSKQEFTPAELSCMGPNGVVASRLTPGIASSITLDASATSESNSSITCTLKNNWTPPVKIVEARYVNPERRKNCNLAGQFKLKCEWDVYPNSSKPLERPTCTVDNSTYAPWCGDASGGRPGRQQLSMVWRCGTADRLYCNTWYSGYSAEIICTNGWSDKFGCPPSYRQSK